MSTLTFNPTDRQWEAWQTLRDPSVTDVLYGGAKGGGKSFLLCMDAYATALDLIQRFDMPQTDHPLHIGWMGRKQAIDFKGTTLQTWQRFIPSDDYEIHAASERQVAHLLIRGTIAIDFGGLDRQESINKFNSAEYVKIWVDQAEETTKDDVSVLRASRRLTIDGQSLDYKGLFTANPAQCWLKEEFILAPRDNYRFVRALPADNSYLPQDYEDTLRDSFRHRPDLLAAYLEGDWDAVDDADQVIKGVWLAKARLLKQHRSISKRFLVCDPARFGDDETVIYGFVDTDIELAEIYGQKDTMYTANRLHILALKHNASHIGVDTIGVGGGVADRLREMASDKYEVVDIDSSEKANDPERYYNRRAEMWDRAALMLNDGDVGLRHADPILEGQLCSPKYEFRNGRMLVEPKEKVKERLLRSPDRADCAVMGWWMFDKKVPDRRPQFEHRTKPLPANSIGHLLGFDNEEEPETAKAFSNY